MDLKTLIGWIIAAILIVGSYYLGKTTQSPPIHTTDTVEIRQYTIVEQQIKLDTVKAYLKLLKSNRELSASKIRLTYEVDSLNEIINKDFAVASLDTMLMDSTRLTIDYYYPPLNFFDISYKSKPKTYIYDTLIIRQKYPKIIEPKTRAWIGGQLGVNRSLVGVAFGYSIGGVGVLLADKHKPIYTVNVFYTFSL